MHRSNTSTIYIISNKGEICLKYPKTTQPCIALSYTHTHLSRTQSNLLMFALICELPSSPCGWLRLINNNSSWLGRNNSTKNKASVNQEGPPWERRKEGEGAMFSMLPSVLMLANWSFVTQIGGREVQRRAAVQRRSFIWEALMCGTAVCTHGFDTRGHSGWSRGLTGYNGPLMGG